MDNLIEKISKYEKVLFLVNNDEFSRNNAMELLKQIQEYKGKFHELDFNGVYGIPFTYISKYGIIGEYDEFDIQYLYHERYLLLVECSREKSNLQFGSNISDVLKLNDYSDLVFRLENRVLVPYKCRGTDFQKLSAVDINKYLRKNKLRKIIQKIKNE